MTDALHEPKTLQGSKLNGQHPLCFYYIGLSLFMETDWLFPVEPDIMLYINLTRGNLGISIPVLRHSFSIFYSYPFCPSSVLSSLDNTFCSNDLGTEHKSLQTHQRPSVMSESYVYYYVWWRLYLGDKLLLKEYQLCHHLLVLMSFEILSF